MLRAMALEPEEWELWDTWVRAQRLLARQLDRGLQRDFGISKAEFSVLMTLHRAAGRHLRVGEIAESLDWEKSRVSHLLTRMEARGLIGRPEDATGDRRGGVGLTGEGRRTVQGAIRGHGDNIRRHFLDSLTPDQAAAIRAWSRQQVERADLE
jgi:DNA-binding MarR family transcriptional regulator